MKVLVVMSRKGGAGKTTVAVNLMLAARAMGVKAVLADADPLRGAGEVLRARPGPEPVLFETTVAKLFALTEACRRSGVELLVIDTPAGPESEVAAAVMLADLCLAVARPTRLDLAAVRQSMAVIRRLTRRGIIVLNQCGIARNGVEPPAVAEAIAALGLENLSVAGQVLRQRLAYQTAFAQGLSVTEASGATVAAREVRDLYGQVWGALHAPPAAPRTPAVGARDLSPRPVRGAYLGPQSGPGPVRDARPPGFDAALAGTGTVRAPVEDGRLYWNAVGR